MTPQETKLIHSEDCRVGTSHNVPRDCRNAEFKPISYPVDAPEPEIGHSEPDTNSEEGRKALEQAEDTLTAAKTAEAVIADIEAQAAATIKAIEGKDAPTDPAGVMDVIPGAGVPAEPDQGEAYGFQDAGRHGPGKAV